MIIGPNDDFEMQVLSVTWIMIFVTLHPIAMNTDDSYELYKVKRYSWKTGLSNTSYFLTKLKHSPVIGDLEIQSPGLLMCFMQGY